MAIDDLKSLSSLVGEEVARIVVAFLASVALNAFLLFGARAAWALYSETNVGEVFLQKYEGLGVQIDSLFSQPTFEFSSTVTLAVFTYTFLIALVMHFIYIRHYLYEPYPLFVKGLWVVMVTIFLVVQLEGEIHIPENFALAFMVVLPSVLCSLPVFLMVMNHAVPDLVTGTVRTVEWVRDRLLG